jgi:hypothetical protein
VAVLLAGLVSWAGAFTDQDAFAVRALSVAIGVAAVATAPSWLLARGALGYLVGLLAKLGVFFALAPAGLATLGLGYDQIREQGSDDWLHYFWATTPLMLSITIIESWLIGLRLAGRRFSDTAVWKHRRRLSAIAAAVAVIGAVWWWVRVDYYLWRIKHGHAPARYSLEKVGERALPRIYRELQGLADADAGSYRSDLVNVIEGIRHGVVARRIRSPLVWEVQAALTDPDPAMVDAVSTALLAEPRREERENISNWSSGLDFNTQAEIFCRAFEKLDPETQGELVHMIGQNTEYATRDYDPAQRKSRGDTSYPFRDLSKPEIAEAQSRMREKLACVTPLIAGALERNASNWPRAEAPFWANQSIKLLARLRPWPDRETSRLEGLLSSSDDPHFVGQRLRRSGARVGPTGARRDARRGQASLRRPPTRPPSYRDQTLALEPWSRPRCEPAEPRVRRLRVEPGGATRRAPGASGLDAQSRPLLGDRSDGRLRKGADAPRAFETRLGHAGEARAHEPQGRRSAHFRVGYRALAQDRQAGSRSRRAAVVS